MTTSTPDGARGPDATGHPEVDRALDSLEGLGARPVAEHLDVLVGVHERLHAALDEHRTADSDGTDRDDASADTDGADPGHA